MAKKQGGLLLFLGAVLGAVAALFFSTTEEGETREVVKKKVKDLKAKLKEARESEAVQKVFGERTEEARRMFREAKDDLAERLAKIRGSWEKIDKQKYIEVVNNLMADLKSNTKMTSEQLKKMQAYLQDDYKKLKSKAKKA